MSSIECEHKATTGSYWSAFIAPAYTLYSCRRLEKVTSSCNTNPESSEVWPLTARALFVASRHCSKLQSTFNLDFGELTIRGCLRF